MSSIEQKKLKKQLMVGTQTYSYYSLPALLTAHPTLSKLPYSLKILLENVIRKSPNDATLAKDIAAFTAWVDQRTSSYELMFSPARVLMQDFTGVPAVVDLAAMRDAMIKLGGNPKVITPLTPVDLVIDHSVMVDQSGNNHAFSENVAMEYQRNKERYAFLRWGQKAFDNFRVVPPGTICKW